MNRKTTILCLLAVVFCLGTAPTVFAQNNLLKENPLPSSRLLNRFGLERGWWAQATVRTTRDKIMHIGIDERSVIALSSAGIVTAFDAETGQKMWINRVGKREQTTQKPVMNEKYVFIVAGLHLYALDRMNGTKVWEINIPKAPSTAPTVDNNQVYIGTLDGSLYAFDLNLIKELYQEGNLPEYTANARVWRYKAGGRVTSPPVLSDRAVSFASTDKSLYSVSKKSRRLLFQFETDAAITAPLVKQGNKIFVASEDFNFYCLNADNGKVFWSFLSGLPIRRSPYVIAKQVFVLPDAGGIIALNTENGIHLWEKPQLRAVDFLAATSSLIFTTDIIGNVLILDRSSGNELGQLPMVPFNFKPNNSLTDRLYLAKKSGLIVMLREQGSDYPAYHKRPAARPILPEIYDPKAEVKPSADPAPDAEEK